MCGNCTFLLLRRALIFSGIFVISTRCILWSQQTAQTFLACHLQLRNPFACSRLHVKANCKSGNSLCMYITGFEMYKTLCQTRAFLRTAGCVCDEWCNWDLIPGHVTKFIFLHMFTKYVLLTCFHLPAKRLCHDWSSSLLRLALCSNTVPKKHSLSHLVCRTDYEVWKQNTIQYE